MPRSHSASPAAPRIPLRNWAAALAAVAILPTGFLFGSWIHERTHDEAIAKEKLAQQHQAPAQQQRPEQLQASKDKDEMEQRVLRESKERDIAALERERRRVQIQWELEDVKNKMEDVKNRGWETAKK